MHRRGFTIAELTTLLASGLVLAALISTTSHRARRTADAGQCASNLATLGAAVSMYTADHAYFPVAYAVGASTTGIGWNLSDQGNFPDPSRGYVHWSGILSSLGYVSGSTVYQCPDTPRGGAPNTNPGSIAADWDPGQVNEIGATAPSALPNDRQAKRLAYTGNAAILTRNHFSQSSGQLRRNQMVPRLPLVKTPAALAGATQLTPTSAALVPAQLPLSPSGTVLLTEFAYSGSGWSTLADLQGVIKSRLPLTPFLGLSAGRDVYAEPLRTVPSFRYPTQSEILPANFVGPNVLADATTELSAVGRHHPGGTANFACLDGHVELTTVQSTVQLRMWGEKFRSITGVNDVRP